MNEIDRSPEDKVKSKLKNETGYEAEIQISGPGVASISTNELLKTDEVKRQLLALSEIVVEKSAEKAEAEG